MSSLPPVHAGLLIGGRSTRMGRPKALLEIAGRTFAERIVAVLRARFDRVCALGNGPLPAIGPPIEVVPDAAGVAGPMAGVLAALRHDPTACWLIVGCDMPLITVEAVDWLLEQRGDDRVIIMTAPESGPPQPLFAIYEPAARSCLDALVARGEFSLRAAVEGGPVFCPVLPPSLRSAWQNVNSPGDLEVLRRHPS